MIQAQIQALKAQALAMVATCDAILSVPTTIQEPIDAPVACEHPSDRRVDVSTMGNPREMCMQCHSEVPQPVETE